MTAATPFINNVQEIRDARHKVVAPYRIKELTQEIKEATRSVNYSWDSMSQDKRKKLVETAEALIERREIDKSKTFVKKFYWRTRATICVSRIAWLGLIDDFVELLDSLNELVDSVLNRVEQENPSYERAVCTALNEVFQRPENSRDFLEVDDEGQWLRELSDQAFS